MRTSTVPDPDTLAAEFLSRGVQFSVPLKDTDDGLRGLELKDADGYVLFLVARERLLMMIRLATTADIPTLQALIAASARALSRGYYTEQQIEAAIRYVFGVDSQLIADGTYFVAADKDEIVGCGGWSWRRTLYGGDQRPMGAGAFLDPAVDAARIRAFFVPSRHARRGIGTCILTACESAALRRGFGRLELMSTLPGVPFYTKCGFDQHERVVDTLPDGTRIEFVRMSRRIVGESTGQSEAR